jgi:Fuc2NAc and GlcNAc transferase
MIVALLVSAGLLAWALTGALRRYAIAHRLMDVPNARSSHDQPTPRGGGLAIVLVFLLALPALAAAGVLPWPAVWTLTGAGGLVAALGWLDDHRHVAAGFRLLAHFIAAAWALAWIGGGPAIVLGGWTLSPGWLATLLLAFYLVWMLNLYNFMDGIDGIAAVEAICVCAGGALLDLLLGQAQLAALPLALAAAVSGFLYWNWPPARIFMGDVGSGFLGLVLGILSLLAASLTPALLWSWLILLGVFVVDATTTLARRLLRGDKVHEAHRSHAYQRAARLLGRHLPVTLAVAAINALWLLPIALWVGIGGLDAIWGMLFAYAPLLFLALRLDAGSSE